ncbi:metal-dependent hydrolase [Paenibacillus crassostreae]|uniref:Hydrolase n=1 Tax=Paenibacillus crassostreae TaxID=1763538 RepID=A0A162N779_9BACL|nr:metal-dependent hydrolase [Paenibacillus crassostreae]AOZ92337.1 hydrolase [Paenibacillus crassostreae]OAB71052.1 hydrolase [Paenibacillus crassostreae]
MDTGTHIVMGLSLAGLAHIDPLVATTPSLAIAVTIGTVLASQAPDLDSVLRLKNNAVYIRNHRGISHSIPFLLIWTVLITAVIALLFRGDVNIPHLALWTGIAVCVHVFSDLFNTYGTQAFRPFTERWVSWNIIHIFDPFIFGTHIAALLLWVLGMLDPAPLFITLYCLTIVYYIWRTLVHLFKTAEVAQLDPLHKEDDIYYLIPTVLLYQWNVVKLQADGSYTIGVMNRHHLQWKHQSVTSSQHEAVEHSKNHPNVQALLYFTSFAVADVEEIDKGYIVRWIDVRYLHRTQYPFVAVVVMDKHFTLISSYIGWLSEDKMNDRLSIDYSS